MWTHNEWRNWFWKFDESQFEFCPLHQSCLSEFYTTLLMTNWNTQMFCTRGTEISNGRAQKSMFRSFTSSAIEGSRKRALESIVSGDAFWVHYFLFKQSKQECSGARTFFDSQKIQTVTVWKSYGVRIVECRGNYTRWIHASGHNSQRARVVRLREAVGRKSPTVLPVRMSPGVHLAARQGNPTQCVWDTTVFVAVFSLATSRPSIL